MDPIAHQFLLCLHAEYDSTEPVTPYSLFNLAFELRPPEDVEFPFVAELWMFARFTGTGVHKLSVEVYAIPPDEDEAEAELVLGRKPYTCRFGNEPTGLSRAWRLRGVPFPRPGLYEFRLLNDDEVLAVASIYLLEQ